MPVGIPLAAAAVGAGASIYSASKQSSAIKSAGNQQAAATAQELQLQQQASAKAEKVLTPYSQEGATARGKYNALLGLGGTPATAAGQPDWDAFVKQESNGGLISEAHAGVSPWAKSVQGMSDLQIAQDWWDKYHSTNPNTLMPLTSASPGTSAEQAQTAAMGDFRNTPFYTLTRDAGRIGRDSILSTAAATGRGTVSGKAMRATQDFTNQNEQSALNSYLTSLSGVADTGFNADSGIASGGQTFANNAANITAAGANSQAQSTIAAANASANGISDALSFAGWGLGQLRSPTQQTNPGSIVNYNPSGGFNTPKYVSPAIL